MKRYRLTFDFKKTEEEAIKFCETINKQSTYYIRKHKPAHFTPFNSIGSDYHFVCWYYI